MDNDKIKDETITLSLEIKPRLDWKLEAMAKSFDLSKDDFIKTALFNELRRLEKHLARNT